MMTLAGIKTIDELELENTRLFIRVDFDVPIDKKSGEILDDARIRASVPTIEHALEAGARVILASHLGHPKGKPQPSQSLEAVGARLAELMDVEVLLPDDCLGDAAKKLINELRGSQLVLLENLRFHNEEIENDEGFARQLGELCDCYVNDAFGASNRAHASLHALPRFVQERACGLAMKTEIETLSKVVTDPDKPFWAVLGGAKISDKTALLESLHDLVDGLVIGGAMANTFLKAMGKDTKASMIEEDKLALTRSVIERAKNKNLDLILPEDVVVAEDMGASEGTVVDVGSIPYGHMVLDIGPKTVARIAAALKKAKTVFWNGPMGRYENPAFATGTFDVAKAIAASRAFSVVGGSDTASAVRKAGDEVVEGFSHISTGGGASLEWVEGRKLPGIEVLRRL